MFGKKEEPVYNLKCGVCGQAFVSRDVNATMCWKTDARHTNQDELERSAETLDTPPHGFSPR